MTLTRMMMAVAAALILAGCLPVTTKTPAGTTAGLKNDAALYGTWKGKNPDDKAAPDGFFHFMQAKNGGFDIALAMAQGSSDDGWSAFTATTATLGKNHVLNAVMTYDKNAPVEGTLKNANIPLLYVVKGRTLTLYLLDEDKIKAAIKAGKIAGTVGTGDNGDAVITAGAAELDGFLARPDAAQYFQRMFVLRKVD